MSAFNLQHRAPSGDQLTDYDLDHAALYLRLLDAEAAGADWREVAQLVLRIDPSRGADRALVMHSTHLARAHWMRDQGHAQLLR